MATPSNASDAGDKKNNLEQITFRFCSECSNMLYPKEDEDAHVLQFTCRTCQFTEPAQSSCVFRNIVNNVQGETVGVTQDVGSDPTVSTISLAHRGCGGASYGFNYHGDYHADRPNSSTTSSLPVLCILCGTAVVCSSCFLPDPTLGAVDGPVDPNQLALCEFQLALDRRDSAAAAHSHSRRLDFAAMFMMANDSDPFSEYDEEAEFESSSASTPTLERGEWKVPLA